MLFILYIKYFSIKIINFLFLCQVIQQKLKISNSMITH